MVHAVREPEAEALRMIAIVRHSVPEIGRRAGSGVSGPPRTRAAIERVQ
jgi:hypothetical protein